MDLAQIIGFVAGFGTTFAALPDYAVAARCAKRSEPHVYHSSKARENQFP